MTLFCTSSPTRHSQNPVSEIGIKSSAHLETNSFSRDIYLDLFYVLNSPHGLTFTWRRCYGLLGYVYDINQPSLPTPFYSVLVSISVFMALSTVFDSINSLDNSPFSHSVLPVLSLPYWSFQPYISLYESLIQP